MNSTLYLKPFHIGPPIPFVKTIQQYCIFQGCPPPFIELLLTEGRAHPGFHKDYKTHAIFPNLIGFAAISSHRLDYIRSIISLLIEHGADINEPFPYQGYFWPILNYFCGINTAIFPSKNSSVSAEERIKDIVKIFIDLGANLTIGGDGNTPWQLASATGKNYLKDLLNPVKEDSYPYVYHLSVNYTQDIRSRRSYRNTHIFFTI